MKKKGGGGGGRGTISFTCPETQQQRKKHWFFLKGSPADRLFDEQTLLQFTTEYRGRIKKTRRKYKVLRHTSSGGWKIL